MNGDCGVIFVPFAFLAPIWALPLYLRCCRAAMGAAMADFWPLMRWVVAIVLASYIGVSGLKKKSLNKSGAIAVRDYITLDSFLGRACCRL